MLSDKAGVSLHLVTTRNYWLLARKERAKKWISEGGDNIIIAIASIELVINSWISLFSHHNITRRQVIRNTSHRKEVPNAVYWIFGIDGLSGVNPQRKRLSSSEAGKVTRASHSADSTPPTRSSYHQLPLVWTSSSFHQLPLRLHQLHLGSYHQLAWLLLSISKSSSCLQCVRSTNVGNMPFWTGMLTNATVRSHYSVSLHGEKKELGLSLDGMVYTDSRDKITAVHIACP